MKKYVSTEMLMNFFTGNSGKNRQVPQISSLKATFCRNKTRKSFKEMISVKKAVMPSFVTKSRKM